MRLKKVLGIFLIIIGVGCITAGAFCLKTSGKGEMDIPAVVASAEPTSSSSEGSMASSSSTVTSTTASSVVEAAPAASANPENDKSESSEDNENHEKGVKFEKYIVNRFGSKYWTIKEWRGDKGVNGRYSESNMNPDLEMKLTLRDKEYVNFINIDTFRNGLLIGLKIPL